MKQMTFSRMPFQILSPNWSASPLLLGDVIAWGQLWQAPDKSFS